MIFLISVYHSLSHKSSQNQSGTPAILTTPDLCDTLNLSAIKTNYIIVTIKKEKEGTKL